MTLVIFIFYFDVVKERDIYQLWLSCLFFVRSSSLKRQTLLPQQKQLQRKEASTVAHNPPPVKPKPTTKLRESNKQQTPKQQLPEDPSKSPKTPLSPVHSSNNHSPATTKPVQPVYPLPDRQPLQSTAIPSVKDKSSMQQYKAHRSSGGSSGNRPHSLTSPTSSSSADHSNSDNNSGASTPLLYGERTSPSGSSCSTSVGGAQRQYTKPTIALMQHSHINDLAGRSGNKPYMTGFPVPEPLDIISLSQCSNSSRESANSNRSKREMRSPEYNSVESSMRNLEMPTAALRHSSGGQRPNELYMQSKRLGSGYTNDGSMSVTSSIEELTAINQNSDYTDQPQQSNVVIVKPQPVAGGYYQHLPGVKDRHVSSVDHKQHVHATPPSTGHSVTSPNSKQANNASHSYHTPSFSSKGFPPGHHHGQFKNSGPPAYAASITQHWTNQRQVAPANSYGKPVSKPAVSPPSVKEGKSRGYLAAEGSDYTNEMIVSN